MWNFRLQAEAERSSLLLTQRGTRYSVRRSSLPVTASETVQTR